jgi:hypothetical protein
MKNYILILGDLIAIALITIIGFATHGEADISFLPRMATTFFPLSVSWFLLAAVMGLFSQETVSKLKQLWRPALVAFFAAPFAAVLRGFILNAPIIPIFAAVLAASSALGLLLWRMIYYFVLRKTQST